MIQWEGRDAKSSAIGGPCYERQLYGTKPITMRHLKEILRLKHQHRLSVREIARSCNLPNSTVGDYLQRAQAADLGWPLAEGLSDQQIMERFLQSAPKPESPPGKPSPDWPALHEQLRRKGVTLQLLWQEYRQNFPEGYHYSRFCQPSAISQFCVKLFFQKKLPVLARSCPSLPVPARRFPAPAKFSKNMRYIRTR